MGVKVTVDTSGVKLKLDRASKATAEGVRAGMLGIGKDWERSMKESWAPGGRNNRGGPKLHARSGRLRRSIKFRLFKRGPELFMTIGGQSAPYAGIQENGGVVRPKRKKFLTIPLPAAMTASGALSGRARIRPAGGRKFKTDFGPTFIFKSKRGNLIVAVKPRTKRSKPKLLYVLKRKVKIKARLKAWESARLDGPRGPAILRRLNASIITALRTV